MPFNPATAVHGPKHVVKRGKTPVLAHEEARQLLGSIDTSSHAGLRDRALIRLMVYTFARIGAATAMKVEDVYIQNRRLWVNRPRRRGRTNKVAEHDMPGAGNRTTTRWGSYEGVIVGRGGSGSSERAHLIASRISGLSLCSIATSRSSNSLSAARSSSSSGIATPWTRLFRRRRRVPNSRPT
jgi:integrase